MIHHLALTASNLERSTEFYGTLLAAFGFKQEHASSKLSSWHRSDDDFELLLYQATPELDKLKHTIYQPGFHHLALKADGRSHVNGIYQEMLGRSGKVLHGPKEYPEYPDSYYALFLTDPDGLKIEIMSQGELG